MISRSRPTRTVLGALLALAWMPAPVFAETPAKEHAICVQGTQCRMASDLELDELRGGFHLDTQMGRLRVGIGITRTVSVDNRLVARSDLVVPDLGQAFAASGRTVAPQISVNNPPAGGELRINVNGSALIVQNGPGNFAPPASAFNAAASPIVVQNSLDNAKLELGTIINASVNSLSLMNARRFGEMLSNATARTGR
jgi:hypothetical protein